MKVTKICGGANHHHGAYFLAPVPGSRLRPGASSRRGGGGIIQNNPEMDPHGA